MQELQPKCIWTVRDSLLFFYPDTSTRPGYGVECLRDNSPASFWQSEGSQPHLINIQFAKKQSVSQVWIYPDINLDDSYTPHKVSLRAGTYHGDLHEVRWVELQQPKGWQVLDLGGEVTAAPGYDEEPVRAHLLQIAIISNHMNGKDMHVRGVRVFAPRPFVASPLLPPGGNPLINVLSLEDDLLSFRTVAFKQHETIR
ncbi:hypothetical protein JCM5296_004376 [Sporobolomyces johnsonii]